MFSESRAIYEVMSKNMVEPEGPQVSHIMVHTSCMLDEHMHAQACIRPRTLAYAHTCSQIQTCSTYCFSMATVIGERACFTLYIHWSVLFYF
jgi:hypothetical protein